MVSKKLIYPILLRAIICSLVLNCGHLCHAANPLQPAENDKELMLQISSDYNKLMFFSLITTIFLAVAVVYLLMSRNRRDKQMEAYITETRIAKKVHDEIANEIFGMLTSISDENSISKEDRQKLIAKLDDIYLMTRNISRETNNIDTGYHFPNHLRTMLNSYAVNGLTVIVSGLNDINWSSTDPLKKIAVFRSLQELMVNMKKHSAATLLTITFSNSNKAIEIRYSDNGKGADMNEITSKNGIQNIETRIAGIGGSIVFETAIGEGFRTTITYPA